MGSLTEHEAKTYSQNGEDGVLAYLLDRVVGWGGWFLEIGAGPGDEGNCLALADRGMYGIFVEGDPERGVAHGRVCRARKYNTVSMVCLVVPDDMALLCHLMASRTLSVLSIDVDGADFWLWEAVPDTTTPAIVVIEYNVGLGPDAPLVKPREDMSPWDGSDFFGASLTALERLGRRKGYTLVHVNGVNAFFLRDDLMADLPPVTVEWVNGPRHPADPKQREYTKISGPGWQDGAHDAQ